MADGIFSRLGEGLKHGWNAFNGNQEERFHKEIGSSVGVRPDRPRMFTPTDRSIIASIYNRMAIDVAAIDIQHVRLNPDGRFEERIASGINYCLNTEANIDQTGRAFRQDMAQSLFERGVIAIVPVETTSSPRISGSYDVTNMRVGIVLEWFPQHVKVQVYNEKTGRREDLTLDKKYCAVVENPLYSVMNEPNGTLQRLIRKLSLLDSVDEATSSGKLDIIIQLPYTIKSEQRKEAALARTKDIEMQLKSSAYGVAYADATERITQLNRPAENMLLKQIEYLTAQLYAQLGLTEEVFNGTADEKTMLNYHNRTVDPILASLTQAMKRTFLTKTARSQGQSIEAYRDPFKMLTLENFADLADKLTRNKVVTANELRSAIGMKPAKEPEADELHNPNIPEETPPEDDEIEGEVVPEIEAKKPGKVQNGRR